MKAFVVGDLHGHADRLLALLEQEGLTDPCEACAQAAPMARCALCAGLGVVRRAGDIELVLLGDVGHFGAGAVGDDLRTWLAARQLADVVLWGNHDRAVVDETHHFAGFQAPGPEVRHVIAAMRAEGRLRLAHHACGVLLTHAGLGVQAHHMLPADAQSDVAACAAYLNDLDRAEGVQKLIVDAIGRERGGLASSGGILWRDWRAPISDAYPQVCGHTKADQVRRLPDDRRRSRHEHLCVDVGDARNGRLAGVWLPGGAVAQVDLAATER